jgi:hypothetical protein
MPQPTGRSQARTRVGWPGMNVPFWLSGAAVPALVSSAAVAALVSSLFILFNGWRQRAFDGKQKDAEREHVREIRAADRDHERVLRRIQDEQAIRDRLYQLQRQELTKISILSTRVRKEVMQLQRIFRDEAGEVVQSGHSVRNVTVPELWSQLDEVRASLVLNDDMLLRAGQHIDHLEQIGQGLLRLADLAEFVQIPQKTDQQVEVLDEKATSLTRDIDAFLSSSRSQIAKLEEPIG